LFFSFGIVVMNPFKGRSNTELKEALLSERRSFIQVGVFSLFINMILLVPPLYMLQVYDRVLASRSHETLFLLTMVLVWMFVTLGLLEYVRSRMLVRLGSRLDHQLHGRVYRAVMQGALQDPSGASDRPLSDLAKVRQFVAGNATFAFFDSPWIPVYIGVLFLFDPWFGWFALFAAAVLGVLALVNEFSTRYPQYCASEAQLQAGNIINAQMRNAEVLHAMGMHEALQNRWLDRHLASLRAMSSAADRAGTWMNLSKTLRHLFQSLMLGLGAWLAIDGQITAGMVIAGSILMGRALAPIDQLIGAWKGFIGARHAYHHLEQLLQQIPETEQRLSLPAPKGEIRVENAVLIPPGGESTVLKGVSLHLRPGEMLAIVGNSAAGKTSLIRAILGLWPLSAGRVQLDGADVGQWNPGELGSHIGYLPQDVELFDGTVAENISRFTKTQDSRIVKAARIAGVDKLIRALPDGYNTRIGAGGVALSGGQRQRIALARAVFGKPPIIILDEPNSNLDSQGELALARACGYLRKHGTTLILASHRRSILRMADKILSLQQGRLHLFGPRDAVLNRLFRPTAVNAGQPGTRPGQKAHPGRTAPLAAVAAKRGA
jgi:ATP-binding cassette subfamily C protein EexD